MWLLGSVIRTVDYPNYRLSELSVIRTIDYPNYRWSQLVRIIAVLLYFIFIFLKPSISFFHPSFGLPPNPVVSFSTHFFYCPIICYSLYMAKPAQSLTLYVVNTLAPNDIYRCSGGECARLRWNVPYVKVHRYNPKHLRISEVERLRI